MVNKPPDFVLPPRWTFLKHHPEQRRLWNSRARFKVVSAGRRSGKTEYAKRYGVTFAIYSQRPSPRVVFAAPTRPQAKDIYWKDLKALVPRELVASISETELKITLWHNNATIEIHGLDKPERIEGSPIDLLILDEFANMKETAWDAHCRPALSTLGRPGMAWLTGVPEGRGHYYDHHKRGLDPEEPAWDSFTWKSIDILPEHEIAEARRNLDPILFRQEYEGSFETITGLLYYCFKQETHAIRRLEVDPDLPLRFAFDFNVDPGTATVIQEQPCDIAGFFPTVTAIIDEVHIPKDSNTELVAKTLMERYSGHRSDVLVYGDPAGGSRHTSSSATDWDLIDQIMGNHFRNHGVWFEKRVRKSDPGFKARTNSTNSRFKTASGEFGMLIDPRCKKTIEDYDKMTIKPGTAGEPNKKDKTISHLSDGVAYYLEMEHSPLEELSSSGHI